MQENYSKTEYVKHPLEHSWTWWYYDYERSRNWKENQVKIKTFDTVEDFWCVYHHVRYASELRPGYDYSLFKKGILPMWEDDANKDGGRWLFSMDRNRRGSDLDNYWLDVMLCLIGEAFDTYSNDVCGAVVNIRGKGDKIALWTRNAQNTKSVLEIGRVFKERLKINASIIYQVHKDTMVKTGSTTKNAHTL